MLYLCHLKYLALVSLMGSRFRPHAPIKRLIYVFVGGFRCVWCEHVAPGVERTFSVNRCSRFQALLLALCQLLGRRGGSSDNN